MVTIRIPKYRIRPDRDIAFVEVFGRKITLGKPNTPESLAAYSRIVQQVTAAKATKKQPAAIKVDISVADLVLAYLDWAKTYYLRRNGRRGGEYDNCRDAVGPLLKLYRDTPASEFGPLALEVVRDSMIGADLSRSTINARIHRIRRVFRWGASKEMIPGDVIHALDSLESLKKGRTPAAERSPVAPVPDADIDAIIPYLGSIQAAMVQLQRVTGMRSDNLCQLRPVDVDRRSEVWLYRPPIHKGSHLEKSLTIPLGPQSQAVLLPFMDDRQPDEFCFSPREAEAERRAAQRNARKTPLTPSQSSRRPKANPKPKGRKGSHYTPGSYRRMIWYAIEKSNDDRKKNKLPPISHWHPHQLRHTVATKIRAQYNTEAARAFLGHSRLSATEIYAERDLGKAEQIAREMG